MQVVNKTRHVDPFFEDAINQVFLNSKKSAFVMDGPLGLGKSSNFVMQGAYNLSQMVKPIRKGDKLVRESKWASIRESEGSSLATVLQLLGEAIFTPEVMSMENSPVKVYSESRLKIVLVSHELPDGTFLEMRIGCYGFNNEAAHNRLRTHEYLGAMIFEMQGIPFNIFEVAIQRCGRFRTADLTIEKEINGKTYKLSGLAKLKIVLCDVNIPERPHQLYSKYYDKPDKSKIPYTFITPPPPLIHKKTKNIDEGKLEELQSKGYPMTRFEGEDVIWLPNPKVYNMTRHFEEKDDDGKNIPWTGYQYWLDMLHLSDSEIRRYVLGIPDTVGGEAAIYGGFRRSPKTIVKKNVSHGRLVRLGYDPGGYADVVIGQVLENYHLHINNEFTFEPSDNVSTRQHFSNFVFPYFRDIYQGHTVLITPDPASTGLGKNSIAGHTESVINMIQDEIRKEKEKYPTSNIHYKLYPCRISNQDTSGRINALRWFIDKDKLSIDPVCEALIVALSGGYQKKKLKSGIISDNIDKDNPYSHPAEAAQYLAVNALYEIKKKTNERKNNSKRRIYTVKRPSR